MHISRLRRALLPLVATVAALALARGTIDMASSCHACDFPLFKSLPTLQDFMITNQFKGFQLLRNL